MTETVPSPPTSVRTPQAAAGAAAGADDQVGARRRPLLTGARAAGLAAAGSLVLVTGLVLVGWLAGDRSGASWSGALRTAAKVWLGAHGTALEVPTGRWSVPPLGLTALPLALLWRAGRSLPSGWPPGCAPGAVRSAVLVAVPYAAVTGAVALLCGSGPVQPSPPSALLAGGAVALLGAGSGALGATRPGRGLGPRVGRTLPAAGTALAALLAAAAVLVGGSLALHGQRAAQMSASIAPGPVDGLGLLLVGLAFVPNAVVWGACWLAGPGFTVGAGTAVGPFGHELGAVPALPLLAALPGDAAPPEVAVLALAVPLAGGALAGRVLHRRGGQLSRTGRVLDVVATAAWCGAAAALLAEVSGGAAGGQRLASVGPAGWAVGLAVAAEVAVTAGLALVVLRRRGRRADVERC